MPRRPPLTEAQIARWADAHHARTGVWPDQRSGPVAGVPGLLWSAVNGALWDGFRGLPGGDSLRRLLCRERGLPPSNHGPRKLLTAAQVLAWADDHKRRTGEYPKAASGPVGGAPGQTWARLDKALRKGLRGLPGGDSLARLLRRERGMAERRGLPRKADPRQVLKLRARGLTLAQIAARVGVSRQRVHQLLQKAAAASGGPPQRPGRQE